MKKRIIAGGAASLLVAWAIVGWFKQPPDPQGPVRFIQTAKVDDPRPAEERASLGDPHLARTAAVSDPDSVLAGLVFVQHAASSAPEFLAEGRIVARTEGAEMEALVHAGAWTMPWRGSAEGWRIEEVWRGQQRLAFMPMDVSSVDPMVPLRAFAYEGVFVAARSSTGEFLADLAVHRNPMGPRGSEEAKLRHPGNLDVMARIRGTDVIPWKYLPALPVDAFGYWVTAPGHDWALIPASTTMSEHPIEVTLAPGAALEVTLEDHKPARDLRLHIMQGGRSLGVYGQLDAAVHRIAGLPPGDCEVWASFESFPRESTVISRSETVRLVAGETAFAKLRMPPQVEAADRGRLAGSFKVEAPGLWSTTEAYGQLALTLSQEPSTPAFHALRVDLKYLGLERMQASPGDEATWTWSLEGIPAGQYTLTVAPLGIELPTQVTGGSTTTVDIVVPPVAVTVVEIEQGGQPQSGVHLIASSPSGETLGVAQRNEEPGIYTLVSLPGELVLHVLDSRLPATRRNLSVTMGWNHVRVALDASHGFTLRGVDAAGTLVDLPWCFDVEVVALGGGSSVAGRSMRLKGDSRSKRRLREALFEVTQPARFVLTFPTLDDGTWAEPLTIAVEAGVPPAVHDVVVRRGDEGR